MKKHSFIISLFLAALIFLISSCGSNRSFSSRKYTAGNYTAHKHKPGKVSVHDAPEQEADTVSKDVALTEKTPATKKTDLPEEELIADKTVSGMVATKPKSASALKTSKKETASSTSPSVTKAEKKDTKRNAFHTEAIKKYVSDRTTRKAVSAGDEGGGGLDTVALVAFILGIVGLALNIITITIIVATAEYILALLFIAGMVLGIMGVVFGTQGLRRHRNNNGSTIDLVFSIIGTAFGAGAIITAFVFAFYTLILAISGI